MTTLHSIDLEKTEDPCFAMTRAGGCKVLKKRHKDCGHKCPFYKPEGCRDWIRRDCKRGPKLIPPEEYEKEIRRKYEQRTDL